MSFFCIFPYLCIGPEKPNEMNKRHGQVTAAQIGTSMYVTCRCTAVVIRTNGRAYTGDYKLDVK